VALWLLAAVVGFAVYLRLSRTFAVNSDGASQALEAWDMLHGNVLLHGWLLTDAPLCTTEIPEYALVEIARGLGPDVVHIAAAITYTLTVLLAAALAKGTATGREAVIRVALAAGIMLAPQPGLGVYELLSSPDHTGTSVPVMLTFLILDRARPRWYVPVATSALLAWSVAGDRLVLVIGIVPLIAVCATRAGRTLRLRPVRPGDGRGWRSFARGQWYEIALAAGACVAAVVGTGALHVLHAMGGFFSAPLIDPLASPGAIAAHNLPITGEGAVLLAGGYVPGALAGAGTWFAMLHVVGVALAACAVLVTAWRFFRGESLLPQLLLAAIVINVAAYAAGGHAIGLRGAREIAPVLPFAAALGGRQLARFLTGAELARRIPALGLGAVLAGYVAGLGLSLTAPEAPPQNARLTAWLQRHHMGNGLSGYWESNVATLTSGGRVGVRAPEITAGRVSGYYPDNADAAWWDPARSTASYVVLVPSVPDYPGFDDAQAVVATFGAPARTYRVGRYKILWWRKNLLAQVGSQVPGASTAGKVARNSRRTARPGCGLSARQSSECG
jgi:hypothetical protein